MTDVLPTTTHGRVVRTVTLDGIDESLLSLLPAEGGHAWVRDGAGFVGWGEAARFVAHGAERFSRAQRWWNAWCETTQVEDSVELPGTGKKKPAELSGGMRKRVGLARAIIYRPEVVFYDEPTTGLDPVVSDSIDKLIVRVCDRLKVTTVVITHDMRSMQTVGRRVAMLHHGRIYTTGTPQELLASTDPVVNRFVRGISDEKEHNF